MGREEGQSTVELVAALPALLLAGLLALQLLATGYAEADPSAGIQLPRIGKPFLQNDLKLAIDSASAAEGLAALERKRIVRFERDGLPTEEAEEMLRMIQDVLDELIKERDTIDSELKNTGH